MGFLDDARGLPPRRLGGSVAVNLAKFNTAVLEAAGVRACDVIGEADFWIPCATKADPNAPTKMIVEGDVSTDHKDFEGENALQDGLMWDYHLQHGWLTDGHTKSVYGGIGHPIKVNKYERTDGHKATHYEAFLLDTPENRKLHASIEATKSLPRSRYGFSIQGPILKRTGADGKTLAQVLITDIAFTRHPVDPYATASAAAKSLDAVNKSLDAGQPAPTYTGGGAGAPLIRQSHNGVVSFAPHGGTQMAKKIKLAKAKELFGDIGVSKLQAACKAADAELDEDEGDDAEKALDAAMAEIREHLDAGGKVTLGAVDEAVKALDAEAADIIGQVVEAQKALAAGQDALAKGVIALIECVKAEGTAKKSIDDKLDQIMARPFAPRSVRPGAPIPAGNGTGGDAAATDFLSLGVARKSLDAALKDEMAKRDGDPARQHKLGTMLSALEARTARFSAKDLEAQHVAIVAAAVA